MCGSCAGSTSSCLPRHTALHCVCVQSCGELTPTASHCCALCYVCRAVASSHPPHHTAVPSVTYAELWRAHTHRVTLLCPLLRMQSCGELTPTASHCTVLCIESCGELTPTVSHCTVLCIESCGKLTPTVSHCTVPCVQSCGSAQCSIILRLHQVLASCCFFFFFCSPLPVLKCRAL